MAYSGIDTAAWIVYGAVVLFYHAIFIGRVSWVRGTSPSFLAQLNHHHWIGRMLGIRGGEIVVMQGLRNSLLAATFVGVLAFTAASEALQHVADARGGSGGGALSPAEVRNLVLGIVYSCSFLNFCLAVRCCCAIGFLLTSIQPATEEDAILRRASAASANPARAAQRAAAATAAAAAPSPRGGGNGGGGGGYEERARADALPASAAAAAAAAASSASGGSCAAPPPAENAAAELSSAACIELCELHFGQLALHFSLGFRSFYLAVPPLLYSAGAVPFIAGSGAVILWLLYVDFGSLS